MLALKQKKELFVLSLLLHLFLFPSSYTQAKEMRILNCTESICLNNQTSDIDISSEGSFCLITAVGNGTFLRNIDLNSNIELITEIGDISNLYNQTDVCNNKAIISASNTPQNTVYKVDLNTNDISQITIQNETISFSSFSSIDGSKFLSCNSNSEIPKLLEINTESGTIETSKELPDSCTSIIPSPNYKKSIVFTRGILNQTVHIYDTEKKDLKKYSIPPNLFFKVDEFVDRASFSLNGNKAVLSSLDGLHIFYGIDLIKDKLIVSPLSKTINGKTLSEISSNGNIVISAAINNQNNEVLIYKLITRNIKKPFLVKKIKVENIQNFLDLSISEDSKEVLLLVKEDSILKVKRFSLKDLSFICNKNVEDSSNAAFIKSYRTNTILLSDPENNIIYTSSDLQCE